MDLDGGCAVVEIGGDRQLFQRECVRTDYLDFHLSSFFLSPYHRLTVLRATSMGVFPGSIIGNLRRYLRLFTRKILKSICFGFVVVFIRIKLKGYFVTLF